jgi:hypothetical protein
MAQAVQVKSFLACAFSNVDYATMALPSAVQAMPGIYYLDTNQFQDTGYFLGILAGQGRGEMFIDYEGEADTVVATVNGEVAVVRGTGYTGTINWFCPSLDDEINLGQLKIDDPTLYAATVANIAAYPLPDEVGIALSCYPSEFEDQAHYIRNITERAAVWAQRGRNVTLFIAYRNSPVGPEGGGELISEQDFAARVSAALATEARVALWHGGDPLD